MSQLPLADVADTERLGAVLASSMKRSMSGPLTVYLQGELGSGKTTLARGLLRELGIAGTVRSPTYTLIEGYDTAGGRVLHVDLYRLSAAAELTPLGLRDEMRPGVLLLIEWPERAEQLLPPPDLTVTLSLAPVGRNVRLGAESPLGSAWLQQALARFQN